MKLNELIDRIYDLKQQKKALDDEAKNIAAQVAELEAQALATMAEVGTDSAKSDAVRATVTTKQHASVTDWDALYAFILDNEAFYLLQRRVSEGAYRDMLAEGEELPGVEPFTKTTLSLRKA